jgi:anaphase-promoting complex subunit 8
MVGTKVKHSELRQAVKDLQNRGLLHSARWAAEQLYGLEDESPEDAAPASAGTVTPAARAPDDEDEAMELETPVSGGRGRGTAGAAGAEGDEQRWRGAGCSPDSAGDDYVLAKAYFDLGEHRRASHQLSENRTSLGRFLRYYALYLAGEKRKNEEMLEQSPNGSAGASGTAGGAGSATVRGGAGAGARAERASARNPELDTIDFDLRVILSDTSEQNAECRDDPFLHYLHGLVLIEKDRKDEARDALAAAARGYPCHWGAWEALMPLCASAEEAEALPLPRHWMRKWFLAALQLELQENRKGLQAYAGLVLDIPASSVGVVQMAVGHYNMREFDRAQSIFEDVYRADPFRLEGMDTYSNILYVKEDAAKLAYLAHGAVLTDKYRPETCCIVGNYYSLKAQHEKAVTYFSRALRLNWRYLSAWTLMGHEYVEMKNPAAAIDAYRHAVDINPRDYRAWYGLGQTYEILQMPYYALYYYQRATRLRPKDPRMWCAMGQCYESEQLLMTVAAIRCYQRAVTWNDMEGIALAKLAKLHRESGNLKAAAHYHRLNLVRLEKEAPDSAETVEALLFLANYYKRAERWRDAEACCTRLLDFAGPEKQNAKALLREMHNIQEARAAGRAAGDAQPPPPGA